MFGYLVESALLIFVLMTLVFLIALKLKDNSIVDIFWGLGFIALVIFSLLNSESIDTAKILTSILVIIWGLRLSGHIFLRNRGKGEDFRYANWRRTWKYFILRSYFQVFMLQGFFMLIIAWPVLHILNNPQINDIGVVYMSGFMIFLAGFTFESVGDYQLGRFKKAEENRGKIITTGLWKYTRHPNYFGEAFLWWGFWLMAVPVMDGIFTIISPLVITWLLRYISGVPMLEKKYEGREDWEEYKRKTPVFVPFIK